MAAGRVVQPVAVGPASRAQQQQHGKQQNGKTPQHGEVLLYSVFSQVVFDETQGVIIKTGF
jgi:hypothetical protein